MELKRVSIDSIKPYESNPRINDGAVDAEQLRTKGKRKYIFVFDKKFRKEWQKKALPYPKKQ